MKEKIKISKVYCFQLWYFAKDDFDIFTENYYWNHIIELTLEAKPK